MVLLNLSMGIHGGVGGDGGGGGGRMSGGQGHGFQKGVVQGGFASSGAVRFLLLASEGNKGKLHEVLEAQERYEEEQNGFIEEQDQMKKDMELMMKEIKRSSQLQSQYSVSVLMFLIVNSLYSNKEVFLRQLIRQVTNIFSKFAVY
ncbi:endoplasmin [Tanacetum coccineum]|uniref:Endoplasmin n=1 Tax=Tanacetum coccineum TaxID=301880 RepID=A0ABQ5FNU6_9ASTR